MAYFLEAESLIPLSDILEYFISMFNLDEDWQKEWLKYIIGSKIRELENVRDFILSIST